MSETRIKIELRASRKSYPDLMIEIEAMAAVEG
jgi:hypothetical protein